VLIAQLLHIIEMTELPNVTVQVVPAETGIYRGLRGAFSLLGFPPDTIGDLGYVDHAAGSLQLVKPGQLAELSRRFRDIGKLALGEAESCDLLLRLADRLSE